LFPEHDASRLFSVGAPERLNLIGIAVGTTELNDLF